MESITCSLALANLPDLEALGGPRVSYLPFGYAPGVHFAERPVDEAERDQYDADVMFAGGADADRVSLVSALIRGGLDVALYGGYWDNDPSTRRHARGFVNAAGLRKATAAAKVCLCLVRRANRDGHSMRSFEVPAMGGCVLAEDTPDHRGIFGDENRAAVFFGGPDEATDKARSLVKDIDRCQRLAAASHRLVTAGGHTYADRLAEIVRLASENHAEDRPGRSRTLSRV